MRNIIRNLSLPSPAHLVGFVSVVVLAALMLPESTHPPYRSGVSAARRVATSPIPNLTKILRPRRVQARIVAIKPPSIACLIIDRTDLDLNVKPVFTQPSADAANYSPLVAIRLNEKAESFASQAEFSFQLTRAGPEMHV